MCIVVYNKLANRIIAFERHFGIAPMLKLESYPCMYVLSHLHVLKPQALFAIDQRF